MTNLAGLPGIVRGRTIELNEDLDAPDGTEVRITIIWLPPKPEQDFGDLPGFGALAAHGDELDEFERWYRAERRRGYENLEPQ